MIIKPFNPIFFSLLLLTALLIVLVSLFFRKKTETQKKLFLVVLCAVNIIVFFVYKGFLSADREFLVISGIEAFNWFSELPLHLCNINMFLIPIGVVYNKRSILGFSFLTAPLGAFMALIFPDLAFTGYSIALPRVLGYYITHLLIFACGILIASLGFYKPSAKDFPRITLTFLAVAFTAHIINTVLRATVCPFANYFYTYGSDISILKMFWKFIPIPFLYELPALIILFSYMGVICFLFYLFDKNKIKKKTGN